MRRTNLAIGLEKEALAGWSTEKLKGALGSGSQGSSFTAAPCANLSCKGNSVPAHECRKCNLVSYCSDSCKAAHSSIHARLCGVQHPRQAGHTKRELPERTQSTCKISHLWGDSPGISLIGSGPVPFCPTFCFASSGDLRDLFRTLGNIPESYSDRVHIHVNDSNPEVAARSFIALELLRLYGKEAIECVIALWFSLAMTEAQSMAIKAAIFMSMQRSGWLNNEVKVSGARFSCGTSSITTDLPESVWTILTDHLRGEFTPKEVREVHEAAGVCPGGDQVSFVHWVSGLVMPFACIGRKRFSFGNGLLLRPSLESGTGKMSYSWPQGVTADPLQGWELEEVLRAGRESGCPTKDVYGALFFHCKKLLASAVDCFHRCDLHMRVKCVEAEELVNILKAKQINDHYGIYISDLSDGVLMDWGPRLRTNGTLVTRFQLKELQAMEVNSESLALGRDESKGLREIDSLIDVASKVELEMRDNHVLVRAQNGGILARFVVWQLVGNGLEYEWRRNLDARLARCGFQNLQSTPSPKQ